MDRVKVEFFEKQVSDNVWFRYITGIVKPSNEKQNKKSN